MTVSRITSRRIHNAGKKNRAYTIHDTRLKGFGLKVAASGRKTFVVNVSREGIRHRETVGDAATMELKEARTVAKRRITALTARSHIGPDTPFDGIAELAMERHVRLRKPSTMRVNRNYLKTCLLPFFSGRTIASITRGDIEDWFAGLHATPASANRALPVLVVILREADAVGARPGAGYLAEGIRRYQNRKRERVLTPEEMGRLGAALDARKHEHPLQTALLRLIVLTGCRKNELAELHWRDYRDGNLHLRDSKNGPKTVYLSSHARAVLEGVGTRRTGQVFPAPKGGQFGHVIGQYWHNLRKQIGLGDVRIHDLRHNYASTAINLKLGLPVIGLLLGHRAPASTVRYAHLDEGMLVDAVERVGESMKPKTQGDAQ